ncbi:MAG: hypothetical protein HOE82_08625 [Gammaproteobacteria bacterium]|nr:hypothetical protein [Gammaproteobacteria bacterium]
MSNELKKTHAKYIPDAKVGDITVGSDVFDEVFVTNLYYKKEYPIFDDNRGMVGNFKTRAAAEAYLAEQGLSTASNRIVETATHACLHVNAEGKALGPAIIRMSSTKLRVSNDWNAEITKTNVPRFASVWKLTPVEQSNAKGSWYNYSIENVGYPDEDTFNFAKAQYESIAPSSAAA